MSVFERRKGGVRNKTYIVMGTGRSGTSFIVDCLMNNGVDMGRRSGGAFHHNLENIEFRKLNTDILKSAGGDAFHPPTIKAVLEQKKKYRKRARELIKKYKADLWGFKDPRTTLALPAYINEFKGDVYFICMVRRLSKVTESIINNNTSRIRGIDAKELARKYINSMIYLIRHFS